MLGKTISHYEIVDLVGRGGMGVVYRARDTKLNRFVALKFLPVDVTGDDRARARFVQEAQAASALEHPNICVIHEIDETEEGQLFMAMAFYDGESLKQKLARSALTTPEMARIGLQICQGLGKAHQRSIIHRDIKPANILVTEDGHVKIVDFGVAKLSDQTGLTREGGVVGTVAYMSPEQIRGKDVDSRTDLWSLGVVLHELLTGKLPFKGGHEQALIYSILNEKPKLRALERVCDWHTLDTIQRCLEPDLELRWSSAEELGAALRRIVVGTPDGAPLSNAAGEEDETAVFAPAMAATTPVLPDFSEIRSTGEVFVGRETEIQRLSGYLETALAGQGQIALVTGEAGQGKTSLVRELCRRAESSHPDLVIGSGKCNAQTGAADPYHPFRDVLGLLSGDFQTKGVDSILTRESAERLWKRIPRTVDTLIELGPDLIDTFIPGRPLLSRSSPSAPSGAPWLDRLRQRIETGSGERLVRPEQSALFDQYARVLQALAQQGPLVLLLEDLHWADPGSIELLAHLGASLSASRTLILGTFRREDLTARHETKRHPLAPVVNDLKRSHGDIEIDLDQAGGREFIDALLDATPNHLDPSFREALHRQTGGLPLFTVELLAEMQDKQFLVEDAKGFLTEAKDLDWGLVPARAEAIVAERIERLPENLQDLLATCAIEGEDFTAEVVAQVLDLDPRETTRLLSGEIAKKHGLVAALSVGRLQDQRVTRYRFRHILFQRYLYERLDDVERSFLHEEVGRSIEGLYRDQTSEVALRLAKHFEHAGIAEKTIQYLREAALGAARLSAHNQVVENLEDALTQLETLPGEDSRDRWELEIRTSLSPSLIALRGFTSPEVEANNLRSQELCEQLPDVAGFDVLWGLFAFDSVRADFLKSHPMAVQMVEAADREGTPIQQMQGRYARGVSEFFLGNLEAAGTWLATMSAVDEPELGEKLSLAFAQDSRKVARCYEGLTLWLQGRPDKALTAVRSVVEWARQEPHPFTLSTVLLLTSFVEHLLGLTDDVEERAAEIVALSEEHSLFQTREGGIVSALARARGPSPTDLEPLEQRVADYRTSGSKVFLPLYLGHLAESYLRHGQPDKAEPLLAEALEISEAGGERFWQAELYRLRGWAATATDPERAESRLRRALEVAQSQSAGALEIRAAHDLAELLSDAGNPDEAATVLVAAVGAFEDTLETPDLVRARQLLIQITS